MKQECSYSDIKIIEDYLNFKHFSSFLPSIAGVDGKPLWVFYANVGQCVGGFGVDNKDTPLAIFDSAFQAYRNIPLQGFRTFIEIGGNVIEAFSKPLNQKLKIDRSQIEIIEETNSYSLSVTYSTVSHRDYAGLLRKVKLTNKTKKQNIRILDGLPVFLPKGISNYDIHELTTLSAAYMNVECSKNTAWYSYSNRGGDNSKVVQKKDGSGFVSIEKNNKKLPLICDTDSIFLDPALREIKPLDEVAKKCGEFSNSCGIYGGFCYKEVVLDTNESIDFCSLYGAFDSKENFCEICEKLSYEELDEMFNKTFELVENLIPNIKTSNPRVDEYFKQSYFDNYLRGGFPVVYKDKLLYLYSRKHGDMERDYNSFQIPSTYFSSGSGNYRDINQNRRNDLLFEPSIRNSNLRIFFSLIEMNGFNPLLVDTKILHGEYKTFKDAEKAILNSQESIRASYVEGYWSDHWTYCIDLLENYLSIYPDKVGELLNKKEYSYFDSGVRIKPRNERYVINEDKVYQYNSVEKVKEEGFIKDSSGNEIKVSLATKIFNLIVQKVSLLDYQQVGIEMLADKPGWNDALNGLPGIIGSSINETIELLRLAILFKSIIRDDTVVEMSVSQKELYESVSSFSGGLSYWNNVQEAREKFEKYYRNNRDFPVILNKNDILLFLDKTIETLGKSIEKARSLSNNGVIPTYFVNEIKKDYQKDEKGRIKMVESFACHPLTVFLEGPSRLLKLPNKYHSKSDIESILRSDVFDKKLSIFKTSANLDEQPIEIGRIKMFEKGWLERESDFLHLTFKYLVGLLKGNYYKEFIELATTNLPCFMDQKVYGRPVNENVSFIVPSNHPDKSKHGQGFYARLTGANTEILNMYQLICFGERVFSFNNGELKLDVKPHIPLSLFDNDKVEVVLFKTKVLIHNKNKRDYLEQSNIEYRVNDKIVSAEEAAIQVREKRIPSLDIYIL